MASFTIERPFELQEQQRDDLTILLAEGSMETMELGVLETALMRLAKEGRRRVIVDFSGVTTMSTLVVAGFAICAESFRLGGREMTVTGASRSLRDAFRMIDSDGRIDQQTDIVAAIRAMSPQSMERKG
jgi:anti-anti-sigma regulatory factor